MFCIQSEEPPSSLTPSTRPENSGGRAWDTALLLVPAPHPQEEPAPILAPEQEQTHPRRAQGWSQPLHMQRTPENTELGSGSLVPGRKAKAQAFASPCKYLHGVFVTAGTEWQPMCEQQCP